jgi:hypothetical protein
MTTISRTKYATGYQSTPIVLMDRVKSVAGADVTQSSLSTITYTVKKYASQADAEGDDDATSVITSTSVTISSSIFDTLQTAAPWDSVADTNGYNFKFTLPAASRPTEGWHRVQFVFTPATGEAYPVVWIIETLA